MMVSNISRPNRVKGILTLKGSLALCCALLVVSVLADRLYRYRFDSGLDMQGWRMTDFLEHLRKSGVRLHVVPAAQHGLLDDGVYLTEDPEATWIDAQSKSRTIERIDQWRGTVWVSPAHPWMNVQTELHQSGDNGCRIGDFLLFGDERLLQRIQEACQ